jgi:hypothetical protein
MIQVNEFSTITEDGRIINWSRLVREEIEQDESNPDAGIPIEMCDCPPLAEYKRIIRGEEIAA